MCRKIGSSRGSSSAFGAAWTIDPAPSGLLAGWHVAVHAVAAVSFFFSGLAWPIKIVGVAAVLAHAALRRPPRATEVRRLPDGTWSLPALGLDRLDLRPGTAVGPFWVRLHLGTADRVVSVLLLRDQLDAETWRRLQAELRRLGPAGTV